MKADAQPCECIEEIFSPNQIRSIHLELTTRCNARCPMCARTGQGAAHPGLAMVDLSIADIRRIFPGELLKKIESIDLCGAFGDPLVASDLDQILLYFREQNPGLHIHIYTNGSLRSPEWWAKLPHILGSDGKVYFGIDGLADTHALYRVGTNYETILKNAATYIGQGGRAQWDFLVFRHNQHQAETARCLAKEMGFEDFSTKVSGRFFRRYYEEMPGVPQEYGLASFPVYNGDGKHSHDLELPDDPAHGNATLTRMQTIAAADGDLKATFDQSTIRCLTIDRGSFFVSAQGTVFPCCWTYIASRNGGVAGMKDEESLRINQLLEMTGGCDAINAKLVPLERIVAGPFFQALAESWRLPTVAQGKPKICARMCGGCFSPKDAYADPALSPYRGSP